jgi:aryl-alcohol dehydrogenase (NADP+)
MRSKSDHFAHDMYYQDTDFDIVERVVDLAKKEGVAPAQIALAWILNKPGVVSPIIGATKMRHLEHAVEAIEIQLAEGDMTYLEELYQPHPILGHS